MSEAIPRRCAHCLAPLRRARGLYHTACRVIVKRNNRPARVVSREAEADRLRREFRRAKGLCLDCGTKLRERPREDGRPTRRCFDCRERHRAYYRHETVA